MISSISFVSGKPNIVFVIADDLGWSDVGYNGASFYETPRIDALSKKGMAFSNAYPGASNCMPSRAIIMTGAYITRTQMWTPGSRAKGKIEHMRFLVPRRGDSKGDEIIPSSEILDPSFITLPEVLKKSGYLSAHFGKWHLGPDGHGFDINDTNGLGADLSKKYYNDIDATRALTDAAIDFVITESKTESPFFLYLAYWDVHTPLVAEKSLVQKYKRKLAGKSWGHDWNPTYAAMIETVDTNVGRLYQAIQSAGIADDTLFIFTSDNGGHAGATPNAPLRGAKGAFYEGGIRVPTFAVWPSEIEANSICDTPITGVDYLPTFAALAKAPTPTRQPVDGRSIVPLLRGESALEDRSIFWHYPLYLQGNGYNLVVPIHGTDRLYWRATPCSVIRKGDWKLIQYFESGKTELFNLNKDLEEQRELSKSHPEKAEDLLQELKQWQRNTHAVIPTTLNPDFPH
ncbi:MAG: sulfatase [Verrucomicrobiota bacterium]|nr:sulfatase [Verrucomicrobiota bacterium]